MDFFKFNPTTDKTVLEKGQKINGLEKSMWVERYVDAGEFSFEAKLSTGLREFLPTGTLISHIDTYDVMIVENHQIKETTQEDPSVVITGRSFESYLENRIVGSNFPKGANGEMVPYSIPDDYTWNQVVQIINDHIVYVSNNADSLINVIAQTSMPSSGGRVKEPRVIQVGTVYERIIELLKVDDLGIRTIRRNTFGIEGSPTQTIYSIYEGANKASSVMFSWKAGDLDSTDYLFSQKSDKNTAFVLGQYVSTVVETGASNYDRRTMLVDAKDIDGHLGGPPLFQDYIDVINAMTVRGNQALANQNRIAISQADTSKTTKYHFRRDYNIGDLVTLDANFNQSAVMRVVEYAEIEDENGESGHPTLALPTQPGVNTSAFV